MNTCICMAESLHCSPKVTTTLLIGHTPVQNVLVLNKNKYIPKKKKKEKKSLAFSFNKVDFHSRGTLFPVTVVITE